MLATYSKTFRCVLFAIRAGQLCHQFVGSRDNNSLYLKHCHAIGVQVSFFEFAKRKDLHFDAAAFAFIFNSLAASSPGLHGVLQVTPAPAFVC